MRNHSIKRAGPAIHGCDTIAQGEGTLSHKLSGHRFRTSKMPSDPAPTHSDWRDAMVPHWVCKPAARSAFIPPSTYATFSKPISFSKFAAQAPR